MRYHLWFGNPSRNLPHGVPSHPCAVSGAPVSSYWKNRHPSFRLQLRDVFHSEQLHPFTSRMLSESGNLNYFFPSRPCIIEFEIYHKGKYEKCQELYSIA